MTIMLIKAAKGQPPLSAYKIKLWIMNYNHVTHYFVHSFNTHLVNTTTT